MLLRNKCVGELMGMAEKTKKGEKYVSHFNETVT